MALLSGILLILAFPPVPLAFLSYIGFIPILYLIENRKRIFGYVYLAFFVWNVGTCYWLEFTAFGVSEDELVGSLLSGFLANVLNPLLMYLPVLAYKTFRNRFWDKNIIPNSLIPFTFPLFWVTFEWLHLHWELSWSWITLGHCMSYFPLNIQYMEITGILGVSLQILLVNILIFKGIEEWKTLSGEFGDKFQVFRKSKYFILPIFLLILPFLSNIYFLSPTRAIFQPKGTLNVRIIQPNIDPFEEKFRGSAEAQIQKFTQMSKEKGIDTIDMILLPETAIPAYVYADKMREKNLISPLWRLVDTQKVAILSGIMELKNYPSTKQNIPVSATPCKSYSSICNEGYFDVFNASALMRPDMPVQTLQKAKLVPMVERVPFITALPFLSEMSVQLGGTSGGYGLPDSVYALKVKDNIRVSPMICYESEYGDYVRFMTQKGGNFMSIITNDGWWLKSSGHIQHAYFTTLRAIENRREIVRSANTGISLFSDSRGNLRKLTEYGVQARIDDKVKLYDGLTFYVKYGDYIGWICGCISLILLIMSIFYKYKRY